jgi:hypothetical protein
MAHPLLEGLDLSNCTRLSDAVMYALAENCPQLRAVFLCSCAGITTAGVLALLQGCVHLVGVKVTDCPLVERATKQLLEERYPRAPVCILTARST